MKFLLITSDYPDFLRALYTATPGLAKQSYHEQWQTRVASLFGVANFYSSNLRKLGHEAYEIYSNNESLQRTWAAEHGVTVSPLRQTVQFCWRREVVPWLRYAPDRRWIYEILAGQINHYRPDVLLVHDLSLNAEFFREMKSSVRLLMGQTAAPIPKRQSLRAFDLMISSLPNYIEHFRQQGMRAELHRLGFEPRVLENLPPSKTAVPVSFVGTVSQSHANRTTWLEEISAQTDIALWGHGFDRLRSSSPLCRHYRGQAWGTQMYGLLRDSRITLNHHIGIAEKFANNLRLYEATGVGTLLITDWKENLPELFEPGREIVAYRSSQECAELIAYYLAHEEERAAIARAGQQRTLRDHTYHQRMSELVAIVQKYQP